MKKAFVSLLSLACASAAVAGASGNGASLTGAFGLEMRAFPEDPAFVGQRDEVFYPSFTAKLDFNVEWGHGHKIAVTPYARIDVYDEERTHFDLREANYSYRGEGWDVLLGYHTVFWGRAESNHLVNIINQVDLVENFDGEQYLGTLMLNLSANGEWGRLSGYVMSAFKERTFPGAEGRLRGPIPFDRDDPTYESGDEEWNIDLAVRYENTVGGLDYALAYFHGTSREPIFFQQIKNGQLVASQHYGLIDQVSLEGAYAVGDWVFKLEALYRFNQQGAFCLNGNPLLCNGDQEDFFATVFGFEYTVKNAFNDGTDLGLLVEVNLDDRNAFSPGTVFDNDLFVGARFTLNNPEDSNILIGALYDWETEASYFYLEASRRFGDNLRVGVEARIFNGDDPADPLTLLDKDSYIQATATLYY